MRSTPFVKIETGDTLQSFVEVAKIPEQNGKNDIAYLSVGTDAMAWYLGRRCGATSLQITQCHPGLCVVVSRVFLGHVAACSPILYLPHLRPLDFPAMTPMEEAVEFLKCREGLHNISPVLSCAKSVILIGDTSLADHSCHAPCPSGPALGTTRVSFAQQDEIIEIPGLDVQVDNLKVIRGPQKGSRECVVCMNEPARYRWRSCLHLSDGPALIGIMCRRDILASERLVFHCGSREFVLTACIICRCKSRIVRCSDGNGTSV